MKRNLMILSLALSIIAILLPLYAHAGYVGDNIPISIVSYDQQNPQVIYLPDKNLYFVVWEDWRDTATTGADIRARFMNGDGTFCGDEIIITNATGNQTAPTAAYRNGELFSPTEDSKILIVWQDTRGNATGGYVYYRDIDVTTLDGTCSAGSYTVGPETPVGYNQIEKYGYSTTSVGTISVTGESIGTGNGTQRAFSGILANQDIVPGSVTITDGTQTLTDDGNSGFTGNGSGIIGYSTGIFNITFDSAPPNGANITADYSYYEETIGTGNGSTKAFSGVLSNRPLVPGTVVVTDGTQTLIDDGNGGFTGDGSGDIYYESGFVGVSFDNPPDDDDPIGVYYSYYNPWPPTTGSVGDELRSRRRPRVSYDPVNDRFWIVWIESRDILNRISELCFGFMPVSWSFGDRSFPGYVMLDGDTLADVTNDLGVTGADIIRNGLTRTNRLISSSSTGLVEKYTYEYFTNINNITVASDTTSPATLMAWEGRRGKGVLTCSCEDSNNNDVCDLGETVTSTFTTSDYDDGLTHIYGLFNDDIYVGVINSTMIDSTNPLNGYYPSIGFDPITDRFLVAWEDMRDGPNTKIYGQILYSGGGLYNDNFIISYQDTDGDGQQDDNVASSKQTKPFVSYDNAEQRFFVVWQDGRNSTLSLENLDIFGQKVDAEGSLRGNNYAVFTLPSNQYYPAIAYDDNLQQFLAVWKDARNADDSTCSATDGPGTGSDPCGSDVYGQLFTLQQPSLTLLNMDDTPLTPPLLDDFENPPGSGSVAVGDYATQSFKIRSTGDTTLMISEIDMTCGGTQTDLSPFSFDGLPSELSDGDPNTTIDLVPGAELTLTVRFTPLAGGTYNKCFIIESNSGNPQVNLSALAIEADIAIDPTTWDFGNVYVGSYGEKTFTVQNLGLATLRISSIDSPSSPFSIYSDGCSGQDVAAGSTCDIVVRFTPLSAGTFNSQFTIHSNDPDTPDLDVPLAGTGLGAQDITVTPSSVDFGDVSVGDSSQQTITVSNDGTADLTINSITPPVAPFSIVSNNCPLAPSVLGVGSSCQIVVEFAPTSEGTTSSNIVINSDDPDEPTVTVNLTGNGVLFPDIDVTPTTIDFGTVDLYTTNYEILTITNAGGDVLTITSIDNPGFPFGISEDNCTGNSLSGGSSCTVTVYFNPTYEGVFDPYFLYINSNDPDEPVFEVILKGTSVAPQYTLTVNLTGGGTGTVTSNDGGIDCGADCSESYPLNTDVTLTANPDAGSTFAGWGGDCAPCGTNTTCNVTMSTDLTCTAQFDPLDPAPDIKANNSDGPVTLNPGDPLVVTVSLDPGSKAGDPADWWMLVSTPMGWYYYDPVTDLWLPGMICSHQAPLFSVSDFVVLNTTAAPEPQLPLGPVMPSGTYIFYFGVDMNMNCILNLGQGYYDSVEVTVNP